MENFKSGVDSLDFSRDTSGALQEINSWVSLQTNGKITELMSTGSMHAATRLVLANAVYFQGNWERQFSPLLTEDAEFFAREVFPAQKIPLMFREDNMDVGGLSGLRARALKLPYKGRKMALYVILPDEEETLDEVKVGLDFINLEKLDSYLKRRLVALHLPKFKLESKLDLVPTLKAMGAEQIFAPGAANFSGISAPSTRGVSVASDGSGSLFIDTVVQKAFIEVNEVGTEAAAATGSSFRTTSASLEEPEVFRCDRPFIFFIKEVLTGLTLFSGKFVGV